MENKKIESETTTLEKNENHSKYCSNCGNKVEVGQAVCGACFFAIPPLTASNTTARSSESWNLENKNGSSRVPAIVLAVFFGVVGAHAYYLGDLKKGLIYTAIFIVSIIMSFPLPIIGLQIWTLIDIFRMATAKDAAAFEELTKPDDDE